MPPIALRHRIAGLVTLTVLRRWLLAALAVSASLAVAMALVVALTTDRWWSWLSLLAAIAVLVVAGRAWRLTDRHLLEPLRLLAAREEGRAAEQALRSAAGEVRSTHQRLTELRGRIRDLERQRAHLEAALSGLSEGVLLLDEAGRGRLANAAFRDIFQLPATTAAENLLDLIRHPELLELVRAVGSGKVEEARLRRSALGERVVSAAVRRVEGGGSLFVVRDETERSRLDEMRRDFVANVSHELKTPLSAIRGFAETLSSGALADPEVAGKFLQRILDQCKRLDALLSDLLPLVRLESESRNLRSQMRTVDLRALAARVLQTVTPMADSLRVEAVLECDRAVEVQGHEEELERMLLNLLDNGLKYNRPRGRVTLHISDTENAATIEIRDTGIGIPKAELERIFERFYRVEKGRSRGEGGTGLGLALVKHAVLLHHGSIDVESEPEGGSTFRVVVPRRQPAA